MKTEGSKAVKCGDDYGVLVRSREGRDSHLRFDVDQCGDVSLAPAGGFEDDLDVPCAEVPVMAARYRHGPPVGQPHDGQAGGVMSVKFGPLVSGPPSSLLEYSQHPIIAKN